MLFGAGLTIRKCSRLSGFWRLGVASGVFGGHPSGVHPGSASGETPASGESGGQAGDQGQGFSDSCKFDVLNCTRHGDIIIHCIEVTRGVLNLNEPYTLQVEDTLRRSTARNHSATHLLHAALREVLGSHVTQAGSLVSPTRLRFDFTHGNPLTPQELLKIESLINEQINLGASVDSKITSFKEATQLGAMALFGEKYGEKVRVVSMGDFCTELCGGTHVSNTVDIRVFKILSETGVSSGVRRIEALTGTSAIDHMNKWIADAKKTRSILAIPDNIDDIKLADWAERSREQIKVLEKKVKLLEANKIDIDELVNSAEKIGSNKIVMAELPLEDREVLSDVCDKIKNKLGSGVILLAGQGQPHPLIVAVSKDLLKTIHAGKILKVFAEGLGGKGGGRPDFAQGAAPSLDNIKQAFESVRQMLQ